MAADVNAIFAADFDGVWVCRSTRRIGEDSGTIDRQGGAELTADSSANWRTAGIARTDKEDGPRSGDSVAHRRPLESINFLTDRRLFENGFS
jgi:hypothetical protein